ncbi:MAG: hypothetical protein WBB69_10295 [Anaerolineales bacterium]
MKKTVHHTIIFCLLLIILIGSLSACVGGSEPADTYDDQIEAGVAATLTKEAFGRSVNSARQTETAKEAAVETVEPPPAEVFTETPTLTLTPEPLHVLIPGAPTSRTSFVADLITVDLAKEKTAQGDFYSWNRLERPYTPITMEYRDYLDIYWVNLHVTDPWVYFTFVLIGNLPEEGSTRYMIEIDLDHDGRGEFLVIALVPPDKEWTTDGVSVMTDEDEDIGGLYPLYMEDPVSEGNGYERVIFSNGEGDDPDLAWVRRDPNNQNQIQLAIKDSLIGTLGFLWSAWAEDGLLDISMFDFNDHITFDEAGSPNKSNYRYPVKAVALVDSTCRAWYGYIPSGLEPGLCFTGEQVQKLPGYGWCEATATTTDCGKNVCLSKCPKNRFCVPCKLP